MRVILYPESSMSYPPPSPPGQRFPLQDTIILTPPPSTNITDLFVLFPLFYFPFFLVFRLLDTRHVYSHHVICFLKSQSGITFIQFVDQMPFDIVSCTFFSEITLFPDVLAFRLIVLQSFNQFHNIKKFLPKLEIQNVKAQPSALRPHAFPPQCIVF